MRRKRVDDRDYCAECGKTIRSRKAGRRGLCRDCYDEPAPG